MSHTLIERFVLFLSGNGSGNGTVCFADLPAEFRNVDLLRVCLGNGWIKFDFQHDGLARMAYVRLTVSGEQEASRLRLTLDSARTSKVAALPEDSDVAPLLNLIAKYYPDKPMTRIVREFYSTNRVSKTEKQIQAMLRKLRRYRNGR